MYTVLICDDQPDIVNALKIYLTPEGYRLLTAYTGQEAVELARREELSLILMDVMMPGMDGLTATREIRTLPRKDAGTIPIFAMTANAFADDIRQSKEINFFYDMDRRRILRG